MKKTLLLLFVLISGYSFSQISITYDNFAAAFSPGSSYLSYSTPITGNTVSVFVGESSDTPQYWDFTNYAFDYIGRSVGIDPATAPLLNVFPTSNYVLFEKGWYWGTDTMYLYNYKELQSDQLLLLGMSDDTSAIFIYDPPAIQALVPLTYGSTWSTSSGTATVDAFGTMKLPSGEYECLRIRWDNVNFLHMPGLFNKTNSRGYVFYSSQIREVNVLNVPEDQFNNTTVDVPSLSYSDREGVSGISGNTVLSLGQNFPNPFSSQTVIRYGLVSGSAVVLKVIDLLGKEVATLVNEKQSAGNHEAFFDASGIPGGVYYYQLVAGDYSLTKKMVINK